jgi:plastocyanin
MVDAQWKAAVGAQSNDQAFQALAFLPNEIWIHAGDRITWTFVPDEIHTLTFLKADQPRPFFVDGCPGFSTDPATYDGSTCVTTPPMVRGQTFTVIFPKAGNFKFVCLVHENMDGRIHVLDASEPLPHDQAFYDKQAETQRHELLSGARNDAHGFHSLPNSPQGVTAGAGKVTANAGGSSTVSAFRFSHHDIQIHAGKQSNGIIMIRLHHTRLLSGPTRGSRRPFADVTLDPDGARHAVIDSTTDATHSGSSSRLHKNALGSPSRPLA